MVDRRLDAGMAIDVEMGLVRLPIGFEHRPRLLEERDPDLVRARFDRQANLQVLVDARVIADMARRHHLEESNALAVQQQLHLVGHAQALDLLVSVAGQTNPDFVLGIQWERVLEDHPAAGADRESVNMPFLGDVRLPLDCLDSQHVNRSTDRETGDLVGGCDIGFEQRGGQIADSDVVEART